MVSYREYVVEILDRFYSTNYNLKTLQNLQFNKHDFSSTIKNRIHVETREILRWKGRIDWYIRKYLDTPFKKIQYKLLAILELGVYEILFDEKIPTYAAINSSVQLTKSKLNKKASGLVNAVLRNISKETIKRKPNSMMDHDFYSYPEWLYNKWNKQFGVYQTRQLCDYFNDNSTLIIRRNNNKITHEDFYDELSKQSSLKLLKSSNKFYEVISGGSFLKSSDFFKNGYFSFQDRGAGMIVEVLDPKPNDTILDVCCAPGTKTNYIAELIGKNGKIYASDIDKNRLESSKKESMRLGNSTIDFEVKDAANDKFPVADKILIDAPCTGTGTIGRRPDIKWKRKPEHLKRIIQIQKSILNNVSKYVKQGGVLVYATCSMEVEENWEVVKAFLKFHDEFKVESIKNRQLAKYIDKGGALSTFPPTSKTDGMFALKMVKYEK